MSAEPAQPAPSGPLHNSSMRDVETSTPPDTLVDARAPPTTQADSAPRTRLPPLRRRAAQVTLPTAAPTYSGLLRSRPSVSYSE